MKLAHSLFPNLRFENTDDLLHCGSSDYCESAGTGSSTRTVFPSCPENSRRLWWPAWTLGESSHFFVLLFRAQLEQVHTNWQTPCYLCNCHAVLHPRSLFSHNTVGGTRKCACWCPKNRFPVCVCVACCHADFPRRFKIGGKRGDAPPGSCPWCWRVLWLRLATVAAPAWKLAFARWASIRFRRNQMFFSNLTTCCERLRLAPSRSCGVACARRQTGTPHFPQRRKQ